MINTKFILKVDRGGIHALESWKDLYQAAIFEPDLNKLPERILESEEEILARQEPRFSRGWPPGDLQKISCPEVRTLEGGARATPDYTAWWLVKNSMN